MHAQGKSWCVSGAMNLGFLPMSVV
jgi:hypothetical protein